MPPSPSRVADLLKGRGVLAVEAEIKRRIRDGTATTDERIEYYTVLKPKTYAEAPPPFMWHETDLVSAEAILRDGFVPGALSNKGEASHLVYGHPPEVVRQRNRSNYARGTPAYLKVDLRGLHLLNIDAIPYVLDSDVQPRSDFVLGKDAVPAGFDGIFFPDLEVAISARDATARVEPVIYGRSGRPLKVGRPRK